MQFLIYAFSKNNNTTKQTVHHNTLVERLWFTACLPSHNRVNDQADHFAKNCQSSLPPLLKRRLHSPPPPCAKGTTRWQRSSVTKKKKKNLYRDLKFVSLMFFGHQLQSLKFFFGQKAVISIVLFGEPDSGSPQTRRP